MTRSRRVYGAVLLTVGLIASLFGGLTAAAAPSSSPSVIDFSQCANGAPPSTSLECPQGMINGALQKSNSHYSEDEVVPQRLVVSVPKGGEHTIVISWQSRKGSANAHAYDSLATWNHTQTGADPCLGLPTRSCPAANGAAASRIPIPLDPTVVPPCAPSGCSAVTSAHQLTGQELVMYGGELIAYGETENPYTHSSAGALGTDDYTTLTIRYRTTGAGRVALLYGGHLAATSGPRGWGSPYGSASISGGPYHFKLLSLDGASAGSRDNQIQAAAILSPAEFTVSKTASPTTASPGDTVTYTVGVTNIGGTPGSTTFTEANDPRVTDVTFVSSNPAGGSCAPVNGTPTTLTCTTTTINPGQTQTFTITVTMPATFTGDSGGGDCDPGEFPVTDTATLANGQQAEATVCVSAAPSFVPSKSASPTTAGPGDTVTYTITITNNGSAEGSTTFDEINDPRVTNVTFTGSTPPGGACSPDATTPTTLHCSTSTLAGGGGAQTFTITADMPDTFTSGENTGGCSAGQFPVIDTVTLANDQEAEATVCVNAAPDFVPSKSANPTTAGPGDTVTYTITITNNGDASGSTTFDDVNDPRTTGVSFVSSSPSGGSCTNDADTPTTLSCTTSIIDPGESQSFTIEATMPDTFTGASGEGGCEPGQFDVTDTAIVAGGSNASATVCVNAAPALVSSKTASATTAEPGDTITYTITITNGGTAPGSTTFDEINDPRTTDVTFESTSPTGGSCTNDVDTPTTLNCTTSTIDPGQSQTFIVSVTMPATFTTGSGTEGCPIGQFPVIDHVVLAEGEDSSATVCVIAAPAFVPAKSASPTTAEPGQLVTYTITVTNEGTASGSTTFDDVNDTNDTEVTFVSTSPEGGSCTNDPDTPTTLHCTTSTIDPGESQTFTITARMPAAFTNNDVPDDSPCSEGQFPVVDTVTLANGEWAAAIVCVNADPELDLDKVADRTTASTGDLVTYTLTYANTGTAPAADTTVTETVPEGTAFSACSDGCETSGDPITSVTWSVGSLPPGFSGTLTLTVQVITFTACTITNTAQISSPDFGDGDPVASDTVLVAVTPTPDFTRAAASGSTVGASVRAAIVGPITLPDPRASSDWSGAVGADTDSAELLSVAATDTAGLLSASVLHTASTSSINRTPAEATNTSTAEAADVCVQPGATVPSASNPRGCLVSAELVQAVARTVASGAGSSFSSAGSTFKNLVVNGVALSHVRPNTTITVPGGTTVTLDEEAGSTSRPTGSSGGVYTADLTVTMIHVQNPALGIDIIVAKAESHALFPQLTVCGSTPTSSVSGHALVASENTDPSLVPVVVGYVEIPPTGGAQSQQLDTFDVPGDGSVASGTAAGSSSEGDLTPTPSAHSVAHVSEGVCLLPQADLVTPTNPEGCLISADLVRSEVSSLADGTSASSSAAGTQLVNVVVAGTPIVGTPPPNTVIALPGVGSVILNEHVCTKGAPYSATNTTCAGATETGMTVTAIHVILTATAVEIIVAQAHSDAAHSV